MPLLKKKKISIDTIIRDYVRKEADRFIGFNPDKKLKTKKDILAYEFLKRVVIVEISRHPTLLPLGLTEEVYMSRCHEAPVLDVKGVPYCSECGYETKVKTRIQESAYGIQVRASTPKDPLKPFYPLSV